MDNNTPDNRIYILQKDLPNITKGTEIKWSDYRQNYTCEDRHNGTAKLNKALVENNPDWFLPKQQPVVKKIEVKDFHLSSRSDKECWYNFLVKGSINENKYEAVKKAIERELNNDEVFDRVKINERLEQLVEMEEVFNAARLTHPLAGFKYDTFMDYCKSKREQIEPIDARQYPLTEKECVSIPTLDRQDASTIVKSMNDTQNKLFEDKVQDKEVGWEILTMVTSNGIEHPYNFINSISICKYSGCLIKSVKRLSDNTVFTVGDRVTETITGKCEGWNIKEFTVKDTRCFAEGVNIYNIEKLIHSESKEQEKPLELNTTFNLKVTADRQKLFVNGVEIIGTYTK